MQEVVPTFHVNVAYKSISVSSLYSTNSKASVEKYATSNSCYHFQCECSSSYIGHSGRALIDRIIEHQQPSKAKGILWHIETCHEYQEKQIVWRKECRDPNANTIKRKNFHFFKSHFKILRKSFRSRKERERAEAFYIRVKRPDLNDQQDHKLFRLF